MTDSNGQRATEILRSPVERFLASPAGTMSIAAFSAIISVWVADLVVDTYAAVSSPDLAAFWSGINTVLLLVIVAGLVYLVSGLILRVRWISRATSLLAGMAAAFLLLVWFIAERQGVPPPRGFNGWLTPMVMAVGVLLLYTVLLWRQGSRPMKEQSAKSWDFMLGRHSGIDQISYALDDLNRAVVDLSAKVGSMHPSSETPRWHGPTWVRLMLPSKWIRDVSSRAEV